MRVTACLKWFYAADRRCWLVSCGSRLFSGDRGDRVPAMPGSLTADEIAGVRHPKATRRRYGRQAGGQRAQLPHRIGRPRLSRQPQPAGGERPLRQRRAVDRARIRMFWTPNAPTCVRIANRAVSEGNRPGVLFAGLQRSLKVWEAGAPTTQIVRAEEGVAALRRTACAGSSRTRRPAEGAAQSRRFSSPNDFSRAGDPGRRIRNSRATAAPSARRRLRGLKPWPFELDPDGIRSR